MKILHSTQQKLLNLLKRNLTDPLTIREMQEILGISSPSVIHHHIKKLEDKGFLRRNPHNPQDYQILSESPDSKISYLNLYGLACCGKNGSMLDGNPIDRIPISTKILGFPSSEAFLIRAKGDSMLPIIKSGDLLVVKKQNIANDGDIVLCINNGEAIIKKIKHESDKIILISLNTKYPPFLAKEDFKIEGVIKSIFTHKLSAE